MSKVLEIPPDPKYFDDVEEHPQQDRSIRIEFYKTPEGKYFVWPYIGAKQGDTDVVRHFQLFGHFPDKAIARQAALKEGRSLITAGFDLEHF